MIKIDIYPYILNFNFSAKTSRGAMKEKKTYFLRVEDNQTCAVGWGECSTIENLSVDGMVDYEQLIPKITPGLSGFDYQGECDIPEALSKIIPVEFPALLMGLETAFLNLKQGKEGKVFSDTFFNGDQRIPINGLVWMGDVDFMLQQVDEKIALGFNTIKLKVGGIDFAQECEILKYIRDSFSVNQITLRLDANGAFSPAEALKKLEILSQYEVHSIEQPLKAGQPEMAEVISASPVPVALDEELIGITDGKTDLLDRLKPHFIVLKPSLHGGFHGCREWIRAMDNVGGGWWITSALESNIGLNAIAQFVAGYQPVLPQGLGTGKLYENNVSSPLTIAGGGLYYDKSKTWNLNMMMPYGA